MQAWQSADNGNAHERRGHLNEVELAIGCGLSEIGGQVSNAAMLKFVGKSCSNQDAQERCEADLHRHSGGACRANPVAYVVFDFLSRADVEEAEGKTTLIAARNRVGVRP